MIETLWCTHLIVIVYNVWKGHFYWTEDVVVYAWLIANWSPTTKYELLLYNTLHFQYYQSPYPQWFSWPRPKTFSIHSHENWQTQRNVHFKMWKKMHVWYFSGWIIFLWCLFSVICGVYLLSPTAALVAYAITIVQNHSLIGHNGVKSLICCIMIFI